MSSKLSSNTASLQSILEAVNNLPNGAEGDTNTSDATATAAEIFQGKIAYAQGRKLTGTFTIDEELNTQDDLIAQIATALEGKAAGGEQATPEISVSSNGLITATAGVKSSTYQMAFQPARTIIPSAVSQVAVSSGYYTGGNITVAGDSNLVAGNIKSGVSIFGVSGTLESGGGEIAVDNVLNSTIARTIKEIEDGNVTEVGRYAFAHCSKLTTVNLPACRKISASAFRECRSLITAIFPACTFIDADAFTDCAKLTNVSFPACIIISGDAFNRCSSLTAVSFPACTSIFTAAFSGCINLTTINLPVCKNIWNNVFRNARNLSIVQLGASSVCALSYSNAFSSTPFAGYSSYFSGTPHIYVPASLITAYQSATNWTYFSSYFSAIESLEE